MSRFPPTLDIVTPEAWDGMYPRVSYLRHVKSCHVFFIHTSSRPCDSQWECAATCKWLQQHKIIMEDRFDMRYSFVIGGDGRIYEARGFAIAPLLPVEYKHLQKRSLLFGIVGKYHKEEDFPIHLIELGMRVVDLGIKNYFCEPNVDMKIVPKISFIT